MKRETKEFWIATTSLTGTMIGVGIFGIPYAISRVGVGLALFYFLMLGGIQLLQNLFLAEAAMACPEKQRLPGLVSRYLGKRAHWVVGTTDVLGLWASLLAYIIVGGDFMHVLLSPWLGGATMTYQLVWAVVIAAGVFVGPDFVTRLTFVGVSALSLALLVIFVWASPAIHLTNFVWVTVTDPLLPYGVVLFALSGLTVIPQMEDTLEGRHEHFRQAIVLGTFIGAVLTAAFGFCVYGVTGAATTPDAVTGLQIVLGHGVAVLVSLIGFIAIMNCSLNVGSNLRTTFQYDYHRGIFSSWLLTVVVPIGLFLVSTKSFVSVISFSGAVFGGVTAIVVALLYVAVTRKRLVPKPLGVPIYMAYVTIVVLASGVVMQLIQSAKAAI